MHYNNNSTTSVTQLKFINRMTLKTVRLLLLLVSFAAPTTQHINISKEVSNTQATCWLAKVLKFWCRCLCTCMYVCMFVILWLAARSIMSSLNTCHCYLIIKFNTFLLHFTFKSWTNLCTAGTIQYVIKRIKLNPLEQSK